MEEITTNRLMVSANEDILYKCTIDELRLRVISDLQENDNSCMNIHELLCIGVYGGSQVRIQFGQL